MRLLFLLISLILSFNMYAGVCTSITRDNNAANSVLTSAKYNLDLNTAYTAHNAFDGGCTSAGTLELDALNTTDYNVALRSPKIGCSVDYQDSNTVKVKACAVGINNGYTYTTADTTVTWGCTGCTAETGSTTYYVYASDNSTTSALTLYMSTTAPGDSGYSGNDRVLGKLYNDGGNNIDISSLQNYTDNMFIPNIIRDFQPVSSSFKSGCAVNFLNDNTLQVGACKIGLKDKYVSTSTPTNVTWGAYGGSAETTTTTYYVYAHAASSSTTALALYMAATAPTGAYVGNDRVLGKLYNDGNNNIVTRSVETFSENQNIKQFHNSAKEGCSVEYTDSNTIRVEMCSIGINGDVVETASGTNVTWGCTNCSAEAGTSTYYVYAASTSNANYMRLYMSTNIPATNGFYNYDRVLGRFYNNGLLNIDRYSIDNYSHGRFIPRRSGTIEESPTIYAVTANPSRGPFSGGNKLFWERDGEYMNVHWDFVQTSAGASDGTGNYFFFIPNSSTVDTSKVLQVNSAPLMSFGDGFLQDGATRDGKTATVYPNQCFAYDINKLSMVFSDQSASNLRTNRIQWNSGNSGNLLTTPSMVMSINCRIPIKGWMN